MDLSQALARQADLFARTVARSAEATAAPLNWSEEQLRHTIPEAVAECQAALDEHLPPAVQASALGGLGARAAAALSALEAAAASHGEQLREVAAREVQRMDAEHAEAVAAQKERHASELAEARGGPPQVGGAEAAA